MVQITPDAAYGEAMLTTLRAGDVTITADSDGRCGSSTLHITAATERQWQVGNARYNNMNPLPRIVVDGGAPLPSTNIVIDPPGMPPACTNCHGDTATNDVFRTISYNPEQTGGFSDQELIDIVTKGIAPVDGFFDSSIVPMFVWSFFHKWSDITGDEAQGMVVYLRSLPPGPSSSLDFHSKVPPVLGNGGAGP